MTDVKWIKINPQFLDGTSFKYMKHASIDGVADFRDKLESVWFELLGLAGIVNNGGYLVSDEIAYKSFEDIAIMLDRTPKEIELCMNFYLKQQMVEIIDDCYCLKNWYKYQSEDGLKKIREQTRIRVAKYRDKKECNVTVTLPVTLPSNSISISNSNSESNNDLSLKKDNCKEEKEIITTPSIKEKSKLEITLDAYYEMRKKIKKPLTEYGKNLMLDKLEKLSGSDYWKKIAILNQSIENSWQGIFELKDGYEIPKEQVEKNTKDIKEKTPEEICAEFGVEL